MTSNNDNDLLQMSGFKKQMLYISLISLVVVACTFAEISFNNKFSQFSSVTAAQRDIIPKEDYTNSASLGGNFKLPNSLSNADRPNNDESMSSDKSRLGVPLNNQEKEKQRHSRVVCLGSDEYHALDNNLQQKPLRPSWTPVKEVTSKTRRSSTSNSSDDKDEDGNVCELSDPSYQTKTSAPSTCNVIHELGFDLERTQYLAQGAFKMAWDLALTDEEGNDEHYVMKTVVYRKATASLKQLNQNTRDALIMERAGRAPDSYEANVLPMYQYCAITALVPFASRQPLDKYIKGKIISAREMYHLALQAARGLYQMQACTDDGIATYAHADVKPPQFLVFDPPQDSEEDFPLLQLNDFNRGRYIKRSVSNKEPCPFQMCGIHHKGSTYRSPEEYVDCADQSAAIDVFSLGSVFFFLMSNGLKPYFHYSSYEKVVKDILRGKLPELPDASDYKEYLYFNDKKADFAMKRSEHPLFIALQDVMKKCRSFKPEDRPTSLEVVQMLEERLKKTSEDYL